VAEHRDAAIARLEPSAHDQVSFDRMRVLGLGLGAEHPAGQPEEARQDAAPWRSQQSADSGGTSGSCSTGDHGRGARRQSS
jgi:hypothetical protein